jgi:type VI secretion system protein ImpJ
MTDDAVHWFQGMFLRPQHFQQAERHAARNARRASRWQCHHDWGLRSLAIDRDALGNHRFVVRRLKARLPDGTLISVPDDGALEPLDLQPLLESQRDVLILLAVPALRAGRPNVGGSSLDQHPRYRSESVAIEDENTGDNPQRMELRRLNLRLLAAVDPSAGYETLPLARIAKGPRVEVGPSLDETYIPPLLACDAWEPLGAGILQAIYDRIGTKLDLLVGQATARGLTFDSQAQGERMLVEQIRVLNEAAAVLGVLAFLEGVHPREAYLTLCRLVGQLAVFAPARRVPPLPRYDHDDLGACFWRVKQHLDALLDVFEEPAYKERPFVGAGLRMEVALDPTWLNPIWEVYLGVNTSLSAEECIRMLTKAGQLDMKVGSADRVDALYRHGLAGLSIAPAAQVPHALPVRPGLHYFRVNRDAHPAEWSNVERSLTLAIRLNETRVLGNIHGQGTLTIQASPGQTASLQFMLFVVPSPQ